jgi:hypothetical protein
VSQIQSCELFYLDHRDLGIEPFPSSPTLIQAKHREPDLARRVSARGPHMTRKHRENYGLGAASGI